MFSTLSSCASIPGSQSTMQGVGHLVLSPFQIVAGVLEGLAALPYYVSTSLHDINHALVTAQASITLEDTYDAAYGRDIVMVEARGDTGQVL